MSRARLATGRRGSIWRPSMMPPSGRRRRCSRSSLPSRIQLLNGPARRRAAPYFAYATNYLIDTKSSVIMDVEATRAIRQAEVEQAGERPQRQAPRCLAVAGAGTGAGDHWPAAGLADRAGAGEPSCTQPACRSDGPDRHLHRRARRRARRPSSRCGSPGSGRKRADRAGADGDHGGGRGSRRAVAGHRSVLLPTASSSKHRSASAGAGSKPRSCSATGQRNSTAC